MGKKLKKIFTKAEVAEKSKQLMKEIYGLSPVSVDEYGYIYDGREALDKIIEHMQKQNDRD